MLTSQKSRRNEVNKWSLQLAEIQECRYPLSINPTNRQRNTVLSGPIKTSPRRVAWSSEEAGQVSVACALHEPERLRPSAMLLSRCPNRLLRCGDKREVKLTPPFWLGFNRTANTRTTPAVGSCPMSCTRAMRQFEFPGAHSVESGVVCMRAWVSLAYCLLRPRVRAPRSPSASGPPSETQLTAPFAADTRNHQVAEEVSAWRHVALNHWRHFTRSRPLPSCCQDALHWKQREWEKQKRAGQRGNKEESPLNGEHVFWRCWLGFHLDVN